MDTNALSETDPRTPALRARRAQLAGRSELHGETRIDDYFWLREKANPEVAAYLEAENAYTDAVMKPTEAVPGGALQGDARPHQGDRPLGAVPRGRLLLLLADRGGEAVPDPLPQEGSLDGAGGGHRST